MLMALFPFIIVLEEKMLVWKVIHVPKVSFLVENFQLSAFTF